MTDFLTPMKIMTAGFWRANSNTMQYKSHMIKAMESKENESFEIRQVCKEFESLFLNHLLKEMRATVPKSGLFDGGQAEQIYTSMFDEQLSQELARHGGVGLAQMIQRSLMNGQNNIKNE
jgi:flagellar protein FlgJ